VIKAVATIKKKYPKLVLIAEMWLPQRAQEV
jgi:hypothetical protein